MASTINDAYLENKVLGASPIELLRLLYSAAIRAVGSARSHLGTGDIASRSKAISQAQAILSELDCSLDRDGGVEIAARLAQLYEYMQTRLTQANFDQSEAPLTEVERLLNTLQEGWQAVEAEQMAMAS